MIALPVVSPFALSGIADALALARASLDELAEDRRTQTVTRRQLEEALDTLADALEPPISIPSALAARLDELARHAETAVDVARTLAAERRDDASAEALAWAESVAASIRGHGARSRAAARRRRLARSRATSLQPRRPRLANVRRDGVRLPVRPESSAALDRLPLERRHARPELLRPARLRSAARELRRDREGRRAGSSLVPARTLAHADRSRLRADLVVGLDVRVPDAVARDARAVGEPARADEPPGGATAAGLRRGARRALGHLGIGVQRARHRAHLSVLELRRSRARLEARAQRRRRDRALRDGARRDGRTAGGGAELRAARRRKAGEAATAGTRRSTTRRRECRRASGSRSCAPTWRITRA